MFQRYRRIFVQLVNFCKLILFSTVLAMKLNLPDYLNDDPQNVIYRQINLMIVGSLQANEV